MAYAMIYLSLTRPGVTGVNCQGVTDARSTDTSGHQVFKFSPDGEVLMILGEKGVGGSGPGLLFHPTDVVVDPNDGDIFVSESHRGGLNNRIVHFSTISRGQTRIEELIVSIFDLAARTCRIHNYMQYFIT
jgi:hypothetical protein